MSVASLSTSEETLSALATALLVPVTQAEISLSQEREAWRDSITKTEDIQYIDKFSECVSKRTDSVACLRNLSDTLSFYLPLDTVPLASALTLTNTNNCQHKEVSIGDRIERLSCSSNKKVQLNTVYTECLDRNLLGAAEVRRELRKLRESTKDAQTYIQCVQDTLEKTRRACRSLRKDLETFCENRESTATAGDGAVAEALVDDASLLPPDNVAETSWLILDDSHDEAEAASKAVMVGHKGLETFDSHVKRLRQLMVRTYLGGDAFRDFPVLESLQPPISRTKETLEGYEHKLKALRL